MSKTELLALADALLGDRYRMSGVALRSASAALREYAATLGQEPVEWVDDLPRLVYEAIGEASMQWHPRPTGVFASSEASAVCDRLIADVRALYAAKEKT